jgi:hypothetical protein
MLLPTFGLRLHLKREQNEGKSGEWVSHGAIL